MKRIARVVLGWLSLTVAHVYAVENEIVTVTPVQQLTNTQETDTNQVGQAGKGQNDIPLDARSEVPLLPPDFFNAQLGTLEDVGVLKQLSWKQFQLKQHMGISSLNSSGEILNFVSFCVASRLSNSRGFSGWALTMRPSDENKDVSERYVTIVLLNNEKELIGMPSPTKWSDYVDNVSTWNNLCKNLVNPKYAM